MHKKWPQVLLLCVAYAICLHGNCAAENNVDNWVKWYEDRHRILFVNENFVNVREYNGRKYLELATKTNTTLKPQNKEYISRIPPLSVLFDVERNTSIQLVTDSKIQAIELTKTGSLPLEYQALLRWAEQKYPALINELREHNKKHPLQIEVSNAPIAGSEAQTVTADGDYGFVQTLGDGPVQFVPRMVHKPPTPYVKNDGITRSYVSGVPASGLHCEHGEFVPPIAPDSGKPLYIIYRESDSTWVHQNNVIEHWILGIFSYDDETDTFTLYESANCTPYKTMHIIDKNQIEIERWSSATGVSQDNPEHFIAKYEKAIIGPEWEDTSFRHCDTDGYGWMLLFDDEPEDEHLEIGGWDWLTASNRVTQETSDGRVLEYSNEVGVDGLFAFLARKGKVGYAPPTSSTAEYIMKAAEDFQASTGHLKYQ